MAQLTSISPFRSDAHLLKAPLNSTPSPLTPAPIQGTMFSPAPFATPCNADQHPEANFDSTSSKSDYLSDSSYKRRLSRKMKETNYLIPPNQNFARFIQLWFSNSHCSTIHKVADQYFKLYPRRHKECERYRSANIFEMSEGELKRRTEDLRRRGILMDQEEEIEREVPKRKYKTKRGCSARVCEEEHKSRRDSVFTELLL